MNNTTLKPLHWLPIMPSLTPISLLCLHLILHSLPPGLWHSNTTCWQLAPQAHDTITFLPWVDKASFWWWPLHQLLGLVFLSLTALDLRQLVYETQMWVSVLWGHWAFSLSCYSPHTLSSMLAGPCLTSSTCREQEPGESGPVLHPLWINTWLKELSH